MIYNNTTTIKTLAVGYGEGTQVNFSVRNALLDRELVPIIGGIAMDFVIVALPKWYPIGTKIAFIDKGDEFDQTGELFLTATNRLPRIYYLDGEVVSIRLPIFDSIDLDWKKYF